MQAAIRAIRTRAQAPQVVPINRRRFSLICLFFLVWFLAIGGKMFWLMIVRHREYVERAEKQQQRTFEVAPRRGILYDRNLQELAMTVQVDSIYADPSQIADKQAAARTLAAIVHTDPTDARTSGQAIAARLNAGHYFAWIARRVTRPVADRVRALKMKGIYFQKEFQRFYPDNTIAAQVLGYVGVDDSGLAGLEEKYDARLHGKPGIMYMAVDARRHILGSSEHDPEPGQNLELTIDANIQYMAERALEHAMERTQALHGTVIIQDVHTGQILALAVRPSFDPNDLHNLNPELLVDRAVSDVYEPGSTFKLVTYAGALDQHLVTPDTMINCEGGQIDLYGSVIHDDKSDRGLGTVTVATALARSSDVGAIKVALLLGPDRLYHYIRDFGFGQKSGIGLPFETRGLLRPVSRWRPASIGYVAIGQEVAVTPIQLVTMVSTIANGGVYLPPHILMPGQLDTKPGGDPAAPVASPFRPDEELPNPLPPGAHRVISTMAAAEMRQMMEGVVLYGTGKTAQLDGYSSAGKTGTAQKIDPKTHRYNRNLHIASFTGFAPVNNPVIAVAVVLDSPKGQYYGTEVAAPVFAEVAQQVLEYLGVPHDVPLRAPSKLAKPEAPVTEDTSTEDSSADINALYDAANSLPSDDPQSTEATQPAAGQGAESENPSHSEAGAAPQSPSAPAKSAEPAKPETETQEGEQHGASAAQSGTAQSGSVTISNTKLVQVPSLTGLSVRDVIERAAAAGLQVEIVGDGTVRQQAPAAGTMVKPGTHVVVKCTR
ncbi:MAG TPA: penicillin-binding transpeptidase domain-containing protein [Terracidiphilus sp.]|nr:penicillin-binding transpeptidase domain-containing protein [Terracidiphilus sp.]